jgi:hypothetical protein
MPTSPYWYGIHAFHTTLKSYNLFFNITHCLIEQGDFSKL